MTTPTGSGHRTRAQRRHPTRPANTVPLADVLADAAEAARQAALRQRWEERAALAQQILPPGWDVYVEPSPTPGTFHAKVSFLVEGGADAFSAIDAVVAYFRQLQGSSPHSGLVIARPADLARLRSRG